MRKIILYVSMSAMLTTWRIANFFDSTILYFKGGSMPMRNGEKLCEGASYPADYTFNLSDFALFLSVMKNKEAYGYALSIILDEPDVKMKEVKVEQVILNGYGKRAIRLDAWGETEDNRQVNMEMENHSENDNVAKRARYYQGLMDSPILKSGKKTKYKQLPSTIIIFITQEDIFKKDLAKYTFTEQCEEIEDLHLEDGTTKIFLNMCSKNGSKELVSLLQYMKDTRIDNPEIVVKDERIVALDKIVTEVRESEEWEAVQMNILDIGIQQGIQEGKRQGIAAVLKTCQELKATKEYTVEKLREEFEISEEEIQEYMKEYWK